MKQQGHNFLPFQSPTQSRRRYAKAWILRHCKVYQLHQQLHPRHKKLRRTRRKKKRRSPSILISFVDWKRTPCCRRKRIPSTRRLYAKSRSCPEAWRRKWCGKKESTCEVLVTGQINEFTFEGTMQFLRRDFFRALYDRSEFPFLSCSGNTRFLLEP